MANSFATVGNLPGGLGTVTVTGAGSNWSNAGSVVVGGQGTGTLTIQDGGTVNSGGGSVGLSAGSNGTVTVTGPGSGWINGVSGGLSIGNFGTGTLTIANGGTVVNITGVAANIGTGAGSQGTVTVTGAGSSWINSFGVNIGNRGTGTLTIADSGVVIGPVVIAANAGAVGTLNIGAGAGNPAAAPGTITTLSLEFGAGTGTLNFNHTSSTYVFETAISGNGTVNALAGTTTLTGANTYMGATNVNAGTLRAGALNRFSPNSAVTVAGGGTLDLNGFSQTIPGVTNAGLVNMGTGTAPGTVLTATSYTGAGGTIAMNSVLGADNSPSDKLVINVGSASGSAAITVTNLGGAGALTTSDGILVVSTTNGGTTAAGAFRLTGPAVAGPYEYTLHRSSVDASAPESWFLRSSLVCTPSSPSPPCPASGPGPTPPEPGPTPPTPPSIPNFRAEVSLYSALPAMTLLYGRNLLDTFHERVGEPEDRRGGAGGGGAAPFGNGAWGRLIGMRGQREGQSAGIFGSGPKYNYDFFGMQLGHDLYRREDADGGRDQAGVYAALGFADGRVTHFDGSHGDTDFRAYSLGAYWTHLGASGWHLDAVLQGTLYYATSSAHRGIPKLTTNGPGIAGSLQGGYPLRFGEGYFIEPQAQLVYQYVDLKDGADIGATVRFSDVQSLAGRVGARFGKTWRWDADDGSRQQITAWIRPNVWHEFLGDPKTSFSSGAGFIPFRADLGGTWMEMNVGVSGKIGAATSLFANASYQTRFDNDTYAWNGKLGLRMSW